MLRSNSKVLLAAAAALISVSPQARAVYFFDGPNSNVNNSGSGDWTVAANWLSQTANDLKPGTDNTAPILLFGGGTTTVSDFESSSAGTLATETLANTQQIDLNTGGSQFGATNSTGTTLTVGSTGTLYFVSDMRVGANATLNFGGTERLVANAAPVIAIGDTNTGAQSQGQVKTNGPLSPAIGAGGGGTLNMTAGAALLGTASFTSPNSGTFSSNQGAHVYVGNGMNGTANFSGGTLVNGAFGGSTADIIVGQAAVDTSVGNNTTTFGNGGGFAGNTGQGIINQNGATSRVNTTFMTIGKVATAGDSTHHNQYNLSAGTLNVGNSFGRGLEVGEGGYGDFIMTGGTANIYFHFVTGGNAGYGSDGHVNASSTGRGLSQISGGSYAGQSLTIGNTSAVNAGAGIPTATNNGQGTFEVVGTGATQIRLGSFKSTYDAADGTTGTGDTNAAGDQGRSQQYTLAEYLNGTLKFDVDGSTAAGVTPINIVNSNNNNGGQVVELGGNLDLSFLAGTTPLTTKTYALIKTNQKASDSGNFGAYAGINATNAFGLGHALTLTGNTTGWSYAVNPFGFAAGTPNAANGYELDATYTVAAPEPASLALLGLGGLVALRRRRA